MFTTEEFAERIGKLIPETASDEQAAVIEELKRSVKKLKISEVNQTAESGKKNMTNCILIISIVFSAATLINQIQKITPRLKSLIMTMKSKISKIFFTNKKE